MLNEFHNAVRRYIEANKSKTIYGGRSFVYQIGEDEVNDASLVSLRAYKSRAYSDIIRLACGTSYSFEPLPEQMIILPSLGVILELQKLHGVTRA